MIQGLNVRASYISFGNGIVFLIILTISVFIFYFRKTTTMIHVEDYTNCGKLNDACFITVVLKEHCYARQVLLSYKLTGYEYFNDDYYKSRDDSQLLGQLSLQPSPNCAPYDYADTIDGKKAIAPCGAIADTMFNDTILILYDSLVYVPMIYTGLVSDEIKEKYKNPPGDLKTAFTNFTKPVNWITNVWELNEENTENNGFQNEAFITWMSRAASTTVQELYGRVDHTKKVFETGLPKGNYTIRVGYNYPVPPGGTKSLVIWTHYSTSLWLIINIILFIVAILSFGAFVYFFRAERNANQNVIPSELKYLGST